MKFDLSKYIQLKLVINFTGLVGAFGFFYSIHKSFEPGTWAGAIMVLGRASIELIKAWRGADAKNTDAIGR